MAPRDSNPAPASQPGPAESGASLANVFASVRAQSLHLCKPLETEDYVVQSMPDASPIRWHLAHTTWFFETFLLKSFVPGFRPAHPQYEYLFNSYYNAVGEQYPRARRGLLTRPTVTEILQWRAGVDAQAAALLDTPSGEVARVAEIGIHHEQQHQELMLTDLLHAFSHNPLRPEYAQSQNADSLKVPPLSWRHFPEGIREIGHAGGGFHFDNETPRHRVFQHGFELASRPVTCGEFADFIADRGYERPELWLANGWDAVHGQGWHAPLYWQQHGGKWWHYGLAGFREVNPAAPVCHVSYYEADACARWAGARLPREDEWEVAAASAPIDGNFAESGRYAPAPCSAAGAGTEGLQQLFGDVWEWTASPYVAYPGYRAPGGALGEYNGKFMCDQWVLRGGSCATPRAHIRASYRNFFPAPARWQFSGFRLARDAR